MLTESSTANPASTQSTPAAAHSKHTQTHPSSAAATRPSQQQVRITRSVHMHKIPTASNNNIIYRVCIDEYNTQYPTACVVANACLTSAAAAASAHCRQHRVNTQSHTTPSTQRESEKKETGQNSSCCCCCLRCCSAVWVVCWRPTLALVALRWHHAVRSRKIHTYSTTIHICYVMWHI